MSNPFDYPRLSSYVGGIVDRKMRALSLSITSSVGYLSLRVSQASGYATQSSASATAADQSAQASSTSAVTALIAYQNFVSAYGGVATSDPAKTQTGGNFTTSAFYIRQGDGRLRYAKTVTNGTVSWADATVVADADSIRTAGDGFFLSLSKQTSQTVTGPVTYSSPVIVPAVTNWASRQATSAFDVNTLFTNAQNSISAETNRAQTAENLKFDKSGGRITGGVVIANNLTLAQSNGGNRSSFTGVQNDNNFVSYYAVGNDYAPITGISSMTGPYSIYVPLNVTGAVNATTSISAPQINATSSTSGDGKNVSIGNDAWLGDINVANTMSVRGQADFTSGFIRFGSDTRGLGSTAGAALTYGGQTVWHAGNDGAGSGLDADLLDGQDSSYFTNVPARLGYTPANRAGDTFTGPIARDAQFYMNLTNADTPVLNFNNNAYLSYVRSTTTYSLVAGARELVRTSPAGFLVQAAVGGEGGQLSLAYANIAAASANSANTWNIDVDSNNNLRGYSIPANGNAIISYSVSPSTGNFTFTTTPTVNGAALFSSAGGYFTGDIGVAYSGSPSVILNSGGVVIAKLSAQNDGNIVMYRSTDNQTFTPIWAGNGTVFNVSQPIRRQGQVVWDAGNDGSGSGLDADLLDGQDGSYYSNVPARLGYVPANRAGDNFSGNVTVAYAGAPSIVLNSAGAVIGKLAAQNDGNIVMYRSTDGQTYTPLWSGDGATFNVSQPIKRQGQAVWDAGNDGAGSGLDADLLDGKDGSEYALKSDLSSLLGQAGGGYQRLPGGLILQWGTNNITTGQVGNVTFPIVFPNAVVATFATTGADVENPPVAFPGVSQATTAGLKLVWSKPVVNGSYGASWFAIGY